jgi:hypothetical protein
MLLRDLDDAKEIFASLEGTIVGVGMTAYSRIVPAYFTDSYRIAALRQTKDLASLRKKAAVFCLEEARGRPSREKGFNAARLLSHPEITSYLQSLPEPTCLLPYQSYPELEDQALGNGWVVLANPASLRAQLAGRAFFERLARKLRLRRTPGGIHSVRALQGYDYGWWAKTLGDQLVVQLPEVLQGGGRGTFFVRTSSEYERLRKQLQKGHWRGVALKSASVRRLVEGTAASIILCITRHGVLFSALQQQLIDLPYCRDVFEKGIFCGHAWGSETWSSQSKAEALDQAQRIGAHLAALGYKGIAGIDFVIENDTGHVYPLEINPRFTGAFPMLSLLLMDQGKIPMEVFHILEFMGASYRVDVEAMNAIYAEPITGSHILLFLISVDSILARVPLRAGLYDMGPKRISFLGAAADYQDIANERQFVVVDGPQETNGVAFAPQDPLFRLCRLLFRTPVVDDTGRLTRRVQKAADWVHGALIEKSAPHPLG